MGITTAEDGLQLFAGTQRTPDTRRQPDKTARAVLKTFRERQHIYEIFQDPGHASLLFGSHAHQPIGGQNGIGEFFKDDGLFRIGVRQKNFPRQFPIEQVGFYARGLMDDLNSNCDFALRLPDRLVPLTMTIMVLLASRILSRDSARKHPASQLLFLAVP